MVLQREVVYVTAIKLGYFVFRFSSCGTTTSMLTRFLIRSDVISPLMFG